MIVSGPEIAAWVYEPLGGAYNEHSAGLGWLNSEGKLVGGFAVEGWNGQNAYVHQRQEGRTSREFWYSMADWCFNQLGCKRITGPVAGSNERAIKLNENIGFKHEATLKGAAWDGTDLHLMVLWRDDCRMLNWKRREANHEGNDNESKISPAINS